MVCEVIYIHAVWEAENDLHMRAASYPRESRSRPAIPVLGPVAIAPPCYTGDLLVNISLACGSSAACNGVEVPRKRDLSVVDVLIVSLECCRVDLGVIVSIHVVEGWRPWMETSVLRSQS